MKPTPCEHCKAPVFHAITPGGERVALDVAKTTTVTLRDDSDPLEPQIHRAETGHRVHASTCTRPPAFRRHQ